MSRPRRPMRCPMRCPMRRPLRSIATLALPALMTTLALGAAACSRSAPEPTPTAPTAPTTPTAPTAGQALPSSLPSSQPAHASEPAPALREAAAEVVLDVGASAAVIAPLPAQILRLHVRPGDTVLQGAVIATVLLPEAASAAAQAVTAGERLALAEARLTAVDALLVEGLARSSDRAELAARAAELRAQRAVALTTLRAAGLGDAAALMASGGRHALRAPVAGVITEVTAIAGDSRTPDDGPLVKILGGGGRRVVARWASSQPVAPRARLLLPDGTSRALTLAATAPDKHGLTAAWYDVDGAPLPATARGRVVVGGAP